jgi:hypothetical protein
VLRISREKREVREGITGCRKRMEGRERDKNSEETKKGDRKSE